MSAARRRLFRFPWRSTRQIRRDVDDELAFHLDMRIAALVADGASRDDARARALREFGDLEDARRYIGAVDRDIEAAQRRSEYMSDLWQDIGYAVRKLRAAPAFTLAAVVTLALGIGANTAIFSVVNSVLLQSLPFPEADRLVRVRYTQRGQGDAGTPMDLIDNQTRAKSFVGFSIIEGTTANVVRDGADAQRVQGVRVNGNYFSLLRIKPLLGRYFVESDDERGGPAVAVISEPLWRRDFGGDTSVIGKTVRVNATPTTIVGVVPAGQSYPITADMWLVKRWAPTELSDGSRGARWLGMLARVKDNVDVAAATRDVERISIEMEKLFPEMFRERRAYLTTVQEYLVGDVRKPLYLMLGAVAFVLLIACANVANLMLVRATAREGEMAIRTALGAGRGRLVRQLITESVLLSICGAIVGLGVAKLGMANLLASAPPSLVVVGRASIDATALAVTAAVAILTGIIFGVLPAAQVGKSSLALALKAGARGTRLRPSAHRAKQGIVVAEVALAVVLLSGAGLLLHSFRKLVAVDPGFRPEGVMSMKVTLPRYDSTRIRNFIQTLETRAAAMPGVGVVGISNMIPLDGGSFGFTFAIRGRPPMRSSETPSTEVRVVTPGFFAAIGIPVLRGRPVARSSDEPTTEVRVVTPGFFAAIGIPVLRGRAITADDRPGAARTLVVNRAFADKFFANENPVGQAITLHWGEDERATMREIVGVVGDVHSFDLAGDPEPTVYASVAQTPFSGLSILVRTTADPTTLAAPLRAIVRELDREVPVYSVQTMRERVAASVGRERFYATLISIFAAVALLLSAVGLYGVIAYAVSQRTHELGVRVALGATGDHISRMVIREGITLTGLGVGLGIVGAFVASKTLSTLLFGVTPTDPATFVSVVVVLGVVAVLASWLPARRASRVDPLVAMRGE